MHTHPTLRYAGWMIGLIVAAISVAGPGCERRIVRESYVPMTGLNTEHPYHRPGYHSNATTARQPAKKNWVDNTLSGMGNLLFGWTRHLAPEPQPTRNAYRSSGPFPYSTTAEEAQPDNP
jgi:hypothetical protein